MARNKKQKVSAKVLNSIVGKYENSEAFEWNGLTITVKKTLSLNEMLSFVGSTVSSCFDQDTGAYLPEAKDFAVRANIIDMYTDISMPDGIERQYDFLVKTDIVERVLSRVNDEQFARLMKAIDCKISNMASANIQMVFKRLDEAASSFDDLQNKFGNMMSGVNADDLNKLIGAISNGGLDESRIVKAYMDAAKSGEK